MGWIDSHGLADQAGSANGNGSPRRQGIHLVHMATAYQDLVSQLRTAFPAPVSDRVHDAYFVFSFLRALDQVDALKTAAPMLGTPVTLDYEAAKLRRVADEPGTLEGVTAELVQLPLGHVHLGTSPRTDQRRAVPDHPEHHRRPPSIDLQPEPGERGIIAAGVAGRGRGHCDDGVAGWIRPRDGRWRVHVRRHGHAAVRRQDRTREGGAERAPQGTADACGARLLRPRALCVPDRRKLARHRRRERRPGADHRRQRDGHRGARVAVARRGPRRPAHRLPRRHDGDDRCVRTRRPRGDGPRPRRHRPRVLARLRSARACRCRHRLGLERVQRLRLRGEPARLPASHRSRARRHVATYPPPGPRRLAGRRLPQDRVCPVHIERSSPSRRARLRPSDAT